MKNIIEFYETKEGFSEVWMFLEKLRTQSTSNKDARIQYKQIVLYIQLLEENGTNLPSNITKHIAENIWELRPGNNRIFIFAVVTIHLFYCIAFVRKHKRHLVGKLRKL